MNDKTNESLREEISNLNEKYNNLNKEYEILQEEIIKIQEDYNNLQNEYSENIIIQSMNEMKIRYESMIKTTVPLYKFKFLNEKYEKIVKNYNGCSILIDHVIKLLREIEQNYIRTENKNKLFKAELELITIKEILEDSVGSK